MKISQYRDLFRRKIFSILKKMMSHSRNYPSKSSQDIRDAREEQDDVNSSSASRQLLQLSPREAAPGASLYFLTVDSGLSLQEPTLKPTQFLLLTTFSSQNTFSPDPRRGEAGMGPLTQQQAPSPPSQKVLPEPPGTRLSH